MASAHRVALVTGGANGIGRAASRHLLAAGWRVGIVDLPGSGLRRAFSALSRDVVLIEGDVCEEATAGRAVAALLERFGKVDGLVANAGIMIRKPLRQLSLIRALGPDAGGGFAVGLFDGGLGELQGDCGGLQDDEPAESTDGRLSSECCVGQQQHNCAGQ
jgi:NAD(P)-dependent dehydrogenase (short-subunit alcohol dehydrogenase family)